ncbi:MAG: TIGR03960 family B12-binding radical SAM protein, partial [Candidatus Omnitrophota bacterium]
SLRENGRKLFSLESRSDLNAFDILGFSLCYELTYTNVLNMLSLGGIPVCSVERGEGDPFVIAGGACCYNPEPMSKFIDVFIIGDGEESLPRFIGAYRELKNKNLSRKEKLRAFSSLRGVYVPSLYRAEYRDGRFFALVPLDDEAPGVIGKNVVEDFQNAYYPEKQIVPLLQTVHDRIAVEIMRGCPNRCRFCQASAVNRPVRMRDPEKIFDICRETYKNTGFDRIALLSLSSVDYPFIKEIFVKLNGYFREKGVGISIPSLRVDEAFYDLPELISEIRKGGLTFAPESASEDVRESLGKDIDMEVLCKSAQMAFSRGWNKMKLYFMVGFPADPMDEADKIIDLAKRISFMKTRSSRGAAEIKISVNPFTPKPHTPLQWVGMRDEGTLREMKRMLLSRSTKKIKIDFHNIEQSLLEACMARGDRRVGEVIHSAWLKGAKMDSWLDLFDLSLWRGAFTDNKMDMNELASMRFSTNSPLPWGHIDPGSGQESFKEEFRKSGFDT